MKQFLAVGFAVFGLSSVSSATFVSCSPVQQDPFAGPAVFSCNIAAPTLGTMITSIQLRTTGSIINNNSTEGVFYSSTFSSSVTSGDPGGLVAPGSFSPSFVGSAGGQDFAAGNALGAILSGLTSTNGFTIGVTVTGSTPVGATQPESSPGSVFFQITTDVVPPPAETPEPSTFVMLGAAFSGLGVLARRRRKA